MNVVVMHTAAECRTVGCYSSYAGFNVNAMWYCVWIAVCRVNLLRHWVSFGVWFFWVQCMSGLEAGHAN